MQKKSSWLVIQVTDPQRIYDVASNGSCDCRSRDCMKWIFWGSTKHPGKSGLHCLEFCWFKRRCWDCNWTFMSFLYFDFRFQSGGWMVPIDLLFLHSIWLTDHSAYRSHIFNKLLCLFVHFNPKMALHIPFCRFVRHKLKKIVFGHAVLFFYGHTFMQTFQIVQNV